VLVEDEKEVEEQVINTAAERLADDLGFPAARDGAAK